MKQFRFVLLLLIFVIAGSGILVWIDEQQKVELRFAEYHPNREQATFYSDSRSESLLVTLAVSSPPPSTATWHFRAYGVQLSPAQQTQLNQALSNGTLDHANQSLIPTIEKMKVKVKRSGTQDYLSFSILRIMPAPPIIQSTSTDSVLVLLRPATRRESPFAVMFILNEADPAAAFNDGRPRPSITARYMPNPYPDGNRMMVEQCFELHYVNLVPREWQISLLNELCQSERYLLPNWYKALDSVVPTLQFVYGPQETTRGAYLKTDNETYQKHNATRHY